MLDATEYRAMAADHHRLAGMCRSPESREQHLRMEKEFRAFAGGEECLHGARAPQDASDPQIVSAGSCPAALIEVASSTYRAATPTCQPRRLALGVAATMSANQIRGKSFPG